jgi:hypothetical protein
MSISIRATINRPDTNTVWVFEEFYADLVENYRKMTQCDTYLRGDKSNDLTVYVDHYFPTDDSFNLAKDTVYTLIPLWQNESNKEATEIYCRDNNITTTIEEIQDPDLSDYTPLHLIR